MECSSIREKLSAYLEDAVSREERVLIEEHLKSCLACSADLADLKKTIEHIRGLEEVEPPAWMAQKIMAELREGERPKQGILRWLFYPPHVKLPLEALAAILVVGIALYIYRDSGPEMKFVKAPSEESAPHISQREMGKEDKRDFSTRREPAPVPSKVTTAPQKHAQETISGKEEVKTVDIEAVQKTPEPPSSTPVMREKQRAATATPSNEPTTFEGALKKEEIQDAVRATEQLKTSSDGETESALVTVRVTELESATKEVERIVTALGGKIVERQYHKGRSMLAIDLYTTKFDELFEKLKRVGAVEEKGPTLQVREEFMKVKIETVEVKSGSPDFDTPR
jgi:hypothetical protein